jgi:hypothetical protein
MLELLELAMDLRDAQHFGDVNVRFSQPLDILLAFGVVHLARL